MMRGDLLTRVISSESEKSFSFAVMKEMGGHRKTGNTVLHTLRDHGVSFAKEKASGKRKKHPRRCLGSQPPPLRGTSFHRKEGESCPRIASPYRHFGRKREIFFVCGLGRNERTSENGKHRILYAPGARRFMQTGKSERSTKKLLCCAYEGRSFAIALLFSISNFQNP